MIKGSCPRYKSSLKSYYQEDIDKLNKWEQDWLLHFNVNDGKCKEQWGTCALKCISRNLRPSRLKRTLGICRACQIFLKGDSMALTDNLKRIALTRRVR
eukprot:sb/3478812/